MKLSKSTLVGVACAACCAACMALYIAQLNERAESARAEALARYGGEQVEVVVASRTISAGETVTEGSIETKLWLADLLPEGAVTSEVEVLGRQLGSSVLKGEVVSSQRLAKSSSNLEVPEGMAAVTVPARDVQALGGALRSGMCVQVYATGPSSTTLLVKDALVLETSVGESSALVSASSAWATLAVPSESAQEIVAAAQNLELYFVLLGAQDSEAEGESEEASAAVSGSSSENAEEGANARTPGGSSDNLSERASENAAEGEVPHG